MDWKGIFGLKKPATPATPTADAAQPSPQGSGGPPPQTDAGAKSASDSGAAPSPRQEPAGASASGGQASARPSDAASAPPSANPLREFTAKLGASPTGSGDTSALNSQIVQAVQLTNSETAAYASNQIAVAPNMMITQASGLVAQAGANYFDGASKLALASKSVLLKNMTEKFAAEDLKGAAEDALGILITDLLVGTAAAAAAAAGAIEAEAAHFALDRIDESLSKYQDLLDKRGG
ncbi:hypothetical protein LQR31_11610 [Chromobacterium vaccinii]|uniref:hypothetical protein n=1 Tax=Chromobacterium vaccinii TaxID=1108595 RepID=UPI001E61588C|nr:hypothetical protein [Chromobacterium vaccinii]MCD4485123.1 hypothetical protein [Chromobacterium vaccinii]